MPWIQTAAMEEKIEFIRLWQTQKHTVKDLCQSFGISRTTAYKYIKQFEQNGHEGLLERSRKPHRYYNQTPEFVEREIVKLKKKYKLWGARKIRKLLMEKVPIDKIPCTVTVHSILRRNGLVKPKMRVRRVKPVYPIFDPQHCNEVWSADFKGKFKMGNKQYCHTLTIADSKSRFLFAAQALEKENFQLTKQVFIEVFKKFGLPKQIHTDNGIPFGNVRSLKRFTRLSYFFIDLGITPVFSDPGQPQQNGRHERMHRDLKNACAKPPAYDFRLQQRSLNRFKNRYNKVRPHEALGMETPASVHKRSDRKYRKTIEEYIYPTDVFKRQITKNGALRWGKHYWIYISEALADKFVGLEHLGNDVYRVYYRHLVLGYFNLNELNMNNKRIKLYNN